ncbi:MAG: T9SS type A sorting domain-containing protein [Rhodothermaceae bacterium]|nr:T9SS type A sorting domain-containing protein [Rhodothermaceae bacterium]
MKTRNSILKIATSLFVFTIASLFLSQAAVAQIVLTKNSFDAFLNGQFTNTSSVSSDAVNIIALLDIVGADQTWDFTTLTYDETFSGTGSVETFSSAAGTPGAGDDHFEQATHVSRSSFTLKGTIDGEEVEIEFIGYEYNILNDDQFMSLGSVVMDGEDLDMTIYSRPGEVYYAFPATFESTWSYDYEDQVIGGGFDITSDYSVSVVVDGWGELITPSGTFNVLRITKTEALDFGSFKLESLEVEFVNVQGFPIATINIDKAPFSEEYDDETAEASLNVISTGTSNPREITSELPDRAALHQNYPNPFNPSTIITYDLAEAATVSLDIYTISGIRVMPVISERSQQAGRHSVSVDASNLASGVYIYQLRTGSQVLTQKMTLIK